MGITHKKDPLERVYRLQEERSYETDKLKRLLTPIDEDELENFISLMCSSGLCEKAKDGVFKFPYVGLVEFRAMNREKFRNPKHDKRIVFVPKFFAIDETVTSDDNGQDVGCSREGLPDAQKIVLSAIFKYRKEKNASLFASGQISSNEGVSSRLAVYIALIIDAMEHGLYLVDRRFLVENGAGEIDWNTTVLSQTPIWKKKRPYYVKLWTNGIGYDESHYITTLHAQLLRSCFTELEGWGLISALGLDLDEIENSDEFDWSQSECALDRIFDEMKVQFVTQKQYTLKLMRAVLDNGWNEGEDAQELQCFGMTGVHELWERAIKDVLRDEINKTPDATDARLESADEVKKTLLAYIDPPVWRLEGSGGIPAEPLEPDFIATYRENEECHFVILDAKYYRPRISGVSPNVGLSGQPGVGDVNKQFLYQLVYKKLIDQNNNSLVHNAFLFPSIYSEKDQRDQSGLQPKFFATIHVAMFEDLFRGMCSMPKHISSICIDGVRLFDYYVKGMVDDVNRSMLKELVELVIRTDGGAESQETAEGAPNGTKNGAVSVEQLKGW